MEALPKQREKDEPAEDAAERIRLETEIALTRISEKGIEAKVAAKVFDDVQEELQQEVLQKLAESNPHDSEGHTMLNLYMRVLSDIRSKIDVRIAHGKNAQTKLINMPRPEGKIRRFINGRV